MAESKEQLRGLMKQLSKGYGIKISKSTYQLTDKSKSEKMIHNLLKS